MKRFKELRTEISELAEEHSEGGGFGYDPVLTSKGRSANDNIQPVNYENDFEMGKINAFIQTFCSKSYLDPKSALYLLRAKLNLANIDLDLNRTSNLTLNTDHEFPLKRFGGTFGTSPTHDLKQGFERTNGFGDRNFVLKVRVESQSEGKAPYYIRAEIVEK